MPVKPEISSVVAIYASHPEAESAVKELQHAGFDMTKLSIIGQDYHTEENVTGYYNLGDRMKKWGTLGAFWGGVWGLLFGAAFFWVPGVGQVLVGGPLIAIIVGALENAIVVGGLSVIGVALLNIGVPKDSALKYESEIKAGKFVVVAHGTAKETETAHAILSQRDGTVVLHAADAVPA
ncbi:MAG: general stress protein [Candidatus Baltobacteraceae bacterium]